MCDSTYLRFIKLNVINEYLTYVSFRRRLTLLLCYLDCIGIYLPQLLNERKYSI